MSDPVGRTGHSQPPAFERTPDSADTSVSNTTPGPADGLDDVPDAREDLFGPFSKRPGEDLPPAPILDPDVSPNPPSQPESFPTVGNNAPILD
jgi:hypothetical protein